jgi:nucleoid-associated protein YgaU
MAAASPLPLPVTINGAAGQAPLQGSATARGSESAAAAAAAPVPDASSASAAAGPLPLDLSIKAAEAEADTLYVAGAAAPGALVRIYADEDLVGEVRANQEGAWLVEARKDVPLGEVVIRADVVDAASASPAAKVELPFTRYADGLVLEPAVTAAAEGTGASAEGDVPQPAFVIIRRGDNLWRISKRNYGRGIRYHSIFGANRDQIRNPNRIYPGQVFIVPTRDRRWEAATN